MNRWIKKLHMYCGLLNFSALVVFGIAGLTATFQPAPQNRAKPPRSTRFVAYTPPPAMSDLEVAADIYGILQLPLTASPPRYAIRRDRDNNLAFDLYTVNGERRITLLEKENRLRVEEVHNSIWHYLDNLHSTTIREQAPDLRLRMWTWYNEFAIWSLIGMTLSGLYLWLSARPGYRPAQAVFLAGSGIFLCLYWLTR